MADHDIRVEYVPLGQLLRWPRNPKSHDLDSLIASMRRWGFTQPLLLDEQSQRILGGHGRLDALQHLKDHGEPPPARIKLKGKEWLVPVIKEHFASEQEAEAYLVADNQLTIAGGWEMPILAEVMADLTENGDSLLSGTGFDMTEVEDLLAEMGAILAEMDGVDLNAEPEPAPTPAPAPTPVYVAPTPAPQPLPVPPTPIAAPAPAPAPRPVAPVPTPVAPAPVPVAAPAPVPAPTFVAAPAAAPAPAPAVVPIPQAAAEQLEEDAINNATLLDDEEAGEEGDLDIDYAGEAFAGVEAEAEGDEEENGILQVTRKLDDLSEVRLGHFKFERWKVPLTPADSAELRRRIQQWIEQTGTLHGFVRTLLYPNGRREES